MLCSARFPLLAATTLMAWGCAPGLDMGGLPGGTNPDGAIQDPAADPFDLNDPTTPPDPLDDPVGDPTNGGCVADRVDPPEDPTCACTFDGCDAQAMSCTCELSCYADPTCLISVDGNGNASTGNGLLGGCDLQCEPEDDLTDELKCTATQCEIQPNTVQIQPVAEPTAPGESTLTAERSISTVDVMFVIDNSGSMLDDQMAAACAMESFFNAAGAGGASYQTAVLSTDMLGDAQAPGGMYSSGGSYLGPPEFFTLDGPCTSTVSCTGCNQGVPSGDTCDLQLGGDFVASDAAGSEQLLKQLIVHGQKGSGDEGGLEMAFQKYAEQERQGTFDPAVPREIVVISDEEADADGWLCPFGSVDRNTAGIPNFAPPPATNTNGGCKQDLINFYTYYFVSRNITVNGIHYTANCTDGGGAEVSDIYPAVIAATGGHLESICNCNGFDDFFGAVGDTTATRSKEICFEGSLPDASTIRVSHVDGATRTTVPASGSDGWTLDSALNCIVMHGTWSDVMGTFEVSYIDPDAPPPPPDDPVACMPPGTDPLLDTIVVRCNGAEVPPSAADGYTFDPITDCFTFHGTYGGVDGDTCDVEYL